MNDNSASVAWLRQCVADFVAAREWERFHTPKNLSAAVAIEAAELMEHFLWLNGAASAETLQAPDERAEVAAEMADVLIYLLAFANACGLDVTRAVLNKLVYNEHKYPVESYRGRI